MRTNKIVLSGLLLAISVILPYFFHLFGMAGPIFLPMHIPVLVGGLLLGPVYGVAIGLLAPMLNSILTGMPPLFPVAVAMSFELATYGFLTGYLYNRVTKNIYAALIPSMLVGRAVSGIANYLILAGMGRTYTLTMFLTAAFVTSIWGIVIQIAFIPILVRSLRAMNLRVLSDGQ